MRVSAKFTLIIFMLLVFQCWSIESTAIRPDLAQNNTEISIASWNLKNFGKTKLKDQDRINIIISVLKKFDIIAIQEVQDKSLSLPTKLIEKINAAGENYNVVSSKRVGRTKKEQYLFVYDDDVIDFIPNTTGYGIEPNNEYSREPFYANFRAGNFDFYLMTIHTDPDDVDVEIPMLKLSYLDLQDETTIENDIILLGDFNAKAPGVTAGSYITMNSIAGISDIFFTIMDETNTRGGRAYDNIIFQSNYTTEYSGASGVYTFWTDYGLTEDEGFKISDHKLVWAKFRIDQADDDSE